MTNNQISERPKGLLRAILLTGLMAGTLDIAAAIIQFCIPNPRNPVRIFEFIASGVFGTSAFSGGPLMAVLGLVFHYFIATAWTSVFFTVYPRIPWLADHKVLGGLLYGIIVWLMMNLVVLPLSNAPHLPIRFPQALIGVAILMVAIGLPISLRASRYYSYR